MGLRDRFVPRHELYVLRCYPKYQKRAVEIKPNSSELSYLLYYASSRPTKLPKVGNFLEKRNKRDVRKRRLGDVQVTAQLVAALIEKTPRHLDLYTLNVLDIISTILESKDINFIEESVQVFNAFCKHYNYALLSANREQSSKFEEIIISYANLATTQPDSAVRNRDKSIPENLRLRSAALNAIKALVSSESFGEDGKHLKNIIPAILSNMYSEEPHYIEHLQYHETQKEEHIRKQFLKDQSIKTRQSVSLQRNTTEIQNASQSFEEDPFLASGTTADMDQRAIDDVGVLAVQSLRQIFSVYNRLQQRMATTVALDWTTKRSPRSYVREKDISGRSRSSWSTDLFETICIWTPVQDHFVVLVAATESLVSSPITEADLTRQVNLVTIIHSLLRSDVNFVGLSIIDVLIGFMQHMLLLLQLGGSGSNVTPHHQQDAAAVQVLKGDRPTSNQQSVVRDEHDLNILDSEISESPSSERIRLLGQIKECIGDLGCHNYYPEQIGDLITEILSRLKPPATHALPHAASAVENPEKAVDAIVESVSLNESKNVHPYFSFATARILALEAVEELLATSNIHKQEGVGGYVGRSKVKVSVWEGTQWLLRDPDSNVRKSYVTALLAWLDYELEAKDKRLAQEQPLNPKLWKQPSVTPKNTFLQLLHLAIYEDAVHNSKREDEILMLHLLLVKLVEKLGVNSLRVGLPMVFALQDEVQTQPDARSMIGIASLVQGYFWAVSEVYEFGNSAVGRQIRGEISRREKNGHFLKNIQVKPITMGLIKQFEGETFPSLPEKESSDDTLRPFGSKQELVDLIADSYSSNVRSPPTSPAISPKKFFPSAATLPQESRTNSSSFMEYSNLHTKVKEELLENWSKESVLSAMAKASQKPVSLTGSGSGGHANAQNHHHHQRHLQSNSQNSIDRINWEASQWVLPYERYHKKPSPAWGMSSSCREEEDEGYPSVKDLKVILAGGNIDRKLIQSQSRSQPQSQSQFAASDMNDTENIQQNIPGEPQNYKTPPETPRRSGDRRTMESDESMTHASFSPSVSTGSNTPVPAREGDAFKRAKVIQDDAVPPLPPVPHLWEMRKKQVLGEVKKRVESGGGSIGGSSAIVSRPSTVTSRPRALS